MRETALEKGKEVTKEERKIHRSNFLVIWGWDGGELKKGMKKK